MRKINNKNKTKISYTILRLATKLFEVDNKTRYYGMAQQLFEAEIHMIKAIKENEGIHVTGLADLLGVTKGAVSQIIMKLERKDMIIKDKDVSNQSRLVLRLTPKGEVAYVNHEKLHEKFDDITDEFLSNAKEENVTFLRNFLSYLENEIDSFEVDEEK